MLRSAGKASDVYNSVSYKSTNQYVLVLQAHELTSQAYRLEYSRKKSDGQCYSELFDFIIQVPFSNSSHIHVTPPPPPPPQ